MVQEFACETLECGLHARSEDMKAGAVAPHFIGVVPLLYLTFGDLFQGFWYGCTVVRI